MARKKTESKPKQFYSKLQLIADVETETISDTTVPGERYSGFVEQQESLRIEGVKLVGTLETNEEHLWDNSVTLGPADVKVGDDVYLVIVYYSDGGTFGRTLGMHDLCGAFRTKAEARARQALIESKEWPTGSNPWTGYFARLESVDIEKVEVE